MSGVGQFLIRVQDVSAGHNTDDVQWHSLPATAVPVDKDGSTSSLVAAPQRSTCQ